MPSKKFHSGSPLGAIRDSRWLNFVTNGAEIANRIGYDGGDVTTSEARTSVLVRNNTGGTLQRFSIVGISDVLITPEQNEGQFLNHFTLEAASPDTSRDGAGRIAVLLAPLADQKIGPALLWGVTPVKIDLPDDDTYTAASLINADATKLDADNDGDIPVIWHEEGPGEKWALVNLGGGAGGSGTDTLIVDGCECDKTFDLEGTALLGSPTVCCEGHEAWAVDFKGSIGIKNLYYLTGDIWSTFNSDGDFDNPFVNDCGSGLTDEYDFVLDLTTNKITLEERAALNCDRVCIEYQRALPFACKRAQQFNLVKHSGTEGLSLQPCICIYPSLGTVECTSNCIGDSGPDTVTAILGPISVDNGFGAFCDECDSDDLCAEGAGTHVITMTGCTGFLDIEIPGCDVQQIIRITVALSSTKMRVEYQHSCWDDFGASSRGKCAAWEKAVTAPYSCTGRHTLTRSGSLQLGTDHQCRRLPGGITWVEICDFPDQITLVLPGSEPADSGHCEPCGSV